MDELAHSPLATRRAGLLLHPTSLPGPGACGELGPDAYRFIDFMAAAGQKVWQVLPMGPTHEDRSPYQSYSAFAGDPELISLQLLCDWGLLESAPLKLSYGAKQPYTRAAYNHFQQHGDEILIKEWERFREENAHWLDDYARFRVLKQLHRGKSWTEWPPALRDRTSDALSELDKQERERLDLERFEQFIFFRQWHQLKHYANERGISIFGDLPIFVAHDSADVWVNRHYFKLDEKGEPLVVAGVPPDYFSATGQRWGNPLYDWVEMEKERYAWWLQRINFQLMLFDLVRIDHFRGFEACWVIPADEETAINGQWVKVPGERLFEKLHEQFDPLPIVAEDLGIITHEVEALRDTFALPGMKILHFAFSGNADNPYLPHNHIANCVVYTGTHDNDTTLGWFISLDDQTRAYTDEYLGHPAEEMPWSLIRRAYASIARLVVVPLQDVLELASDARMNIPGTTEGNWLWRFQWEQFDDETSDRLRHLTTMYQR
jgi:4-alpha-glucanotransferase